MKRFNIFRTKKSQIFEVACRNFRNLWETGKTVEVERMNGYDYVRMSGYINGIHYQTHINSPLLAARCGNWGRRMVVDNDTELIRIFAVACACADFGEYVDKFRNMWRDLVLNYSR